MYSPGLNDWEAYIRAYHGEIFAIRRGYYYHVQQRGEIGHQAAKGVSKVMSLPFTEFFFKKKPPPTTAMRKQERMGGPKIVDQTTVKEQNRKSSGKSFIIHSFRDSLVLQNMNPAHYLFYICIYPTNRTKNAPFEKKKKKTSPPLVAIRRPFLTLVLNFGERDLEI